MNLKWVKNEPEIGSKMNLKLGRKWTWNWVENEPEIGSKMNLKWVENEPEIGSKMNLKFGRFLIEIKNPESEP